MRNIHKIIIAVFFVCVFVGAFLPFDLYNDMDMKNRSAGISSLHWLGTDFLGRDVFYRMLRGAYNVALISLSSIVISLIIGGIPAILMASKKTNWRYVVNGTMDIMFVFPTILIALVLVAIFGASIYVAIISISVFFIPVFYRVIYLSSRSVWQADFITSARLSNVSMYKIILNHILPNIRHIIIAQSSIQFAVAIISESGLGYLGLSVESSQPTWGSMMLDAQNSWFVDPYFIFPVGLTMGLTIYSFMKYGDGYKNDKN
ncbi:MAG: ABC transporter permease [Alphaproteobacteria bacterium]